MKGIQSILGRTHNGWQAKGASIGLILGLSLVLLTGHFFIDLLYLGQHESDDILIINKQFDRHYGDKRVFSDAEIEEINDQSFFNDIAVFTSNDFEVMLRSDRLGFRTLIFFQEVPNRYLEVDTLDFKWEEGEKVPIILSKDYLALYNYGFAPSQGLPNIPESAVSLVDFDIQVSGNGSRQGFKGYIHGFTSNFNSILVPSSFMAHCNGRFGSPQNKGVKQVIARTDQPGAPAMVDFMDRKGYELSRSALIGSEWVVAIKLVLLFVLILGAALLCLSILVYLLFLGKQLSERLPQVTLLLDLGYRPAQIAASLIQTIRSELVWSLVIGVSLYLFGRLGIQQLASSNGVDLVIYPMLLFSVVGVSLVALLYFLLYKTVFQSVQ